MAEYARSRPPDAVDIEAVTGAVLTASRLLLAVSTRSLAAVADRVTLPQFRLLVVLATHGDAKLVEVAERLGVNPSTAMRMLDRLIAAGLADRQSNPDNRRETMLRLTPEGRGVVDDVTAARRREITAIVERLTPGQRSDLVAALTAFTEAGGEPTAPGEEAEPYLGGRPQDTEPAERPRREPGNEPGQEPCEQPRKPSREQHEERPPKPPREGRRERPDGGSLPRP